MSEQLEAQAKEMKVKIYDLSEQVTQLNNIIGQVATGLGCVVEGQIDLDALMSVVNDYESEQKQPEEGED